MYFYRKLGFALLITLFSCLAIPLYPIHAKAQAPTLEDKIRSKAIGESLGLTAKKFKEIALKYDKKGELIFEELKNIDKEIEIAEEAYKQDIRNPNKRSMVHSKKLNKTLTKSQQSIGKSSSLVFKKMADGLKITGSALAIKTIIDRVDHLIHEMNTKVDEEEMVLLHAGVPLITAIIEAGLCKLNLCMLGFALDYGGPALASVPEGNRLMSEPIDNRIELHKIFIESIAFRGIHDGENQKKQTEHELDSWIRTHVEGDSRFFITTRKSIEEAFGTSQPKEFIGQKSMIETILYKLQTKLRDKFPILESGLLEELKKSEILFLCKNSVDRKGNCSKPGSYGDLTDRLKKVYSDSYLVGKFNAKFKQLWINREAYYAKIRKALQGLKQPNIYNLAFIIDRSGSMGEISIGQDNRKSQKLARALAAVKAKVKVMKDDEYLSISSFSDGGSTQLVSAPLSAVRGQIPQMLASITAGGGTNIGAGLAEGRKQLEKSGGGYALLLSDGKGGGWQDELTKYKAKKWKICTIAYGADADVATLQRIANESGCTYAPSDASNIPSRMHDVDAYAKNKSSPLTITDLLSPSAQVYYPFKVSFGSVLFNLFTSWQGSRLSTVLVSPSGQRIDVENISPEEGRYREGDTFQYVELNKPEAGEWTIEASWSEPPDSAELVNFSIAEQSDVFSRIHNFNSYYQIGQPVDLLVDAMEIIRDEKQALANATVQVDVQVPGQAAVDLIFDPRASIDIYQKVARQLSRGQHLKDDGQSRDYAPGDSIFGGRFTETNNPGIYLVKATITGQKSDGTKVSREALSTFQVGSVLKNPITTSQLLGFYKKSWNKITEKEIADDDFYSTAAEDVQELLNDNEGIEDLMGSDDDSVIEGIPGFD